MEKANRFDYVKYDEKAVTDQHFFKDIFMRLEKEIDERLQGGRATSLSMTKLEECYMWIGKQIRDDQIKRNGSAELQEQRNNS